MFSTQEENFYSKQLVLPGFGFSGQSKLRNSRVLVAGAGGLGSSLLLYLAGAGIGNITIADGDIVQINNLHRQILYSTNDVGKRKAVVAAERLRSINPFINIISLPQYITAENAVEVFENIDVVVDATDNFEARFLIGDYTHKKGIPLVYAAIFGFEGQLTVFNYNNGPGIMDLFPNRPMAGAAPDCNQNGVVGVVPGTLGCLQAAETIKIVAGLGSVLSGKLLVIDLLSMKTKELRIKQGSYVQGSVQVDANDVSGQRVDEINVQQLKKIRNQVFLLDVREPYEFNQYSVGGVLIPLGQLKARMDEIPFDKDIAVVCKSGVRSFMAAKLIMEHRKNIRIYNLKGGLLLWHSEENNDSTH